MEVLMPFENFSPRLFTAAAMREHAPIKSGVYGISTARQWLYIGETDNIQETLLEHLKDLHRVEARKKPTGFAFEVCARADRPERQNRLVMEYEPAINRGGTWPQ
jgi:predicted GIY-YIG superfamily endonuclease